MSTLHSFSLARFLSRHASLSAAAILATFFILVSAVIFADQSFDAVVFLEHLPFLLFSIGVGALVFYWARHIAGGRAGVIAVGLYALSPHVIAQSAQLSQELSTTLLYAALLLGCAFLVSRFSGRIRLFDTVIALSVLGIAASVTLTITAIYDPMLLQDYVIAFFLRQPLGLVALFLITIIVGIVSSVRMRHSTYLTHTSPLRAFISTHRADFVIFIVIGFFLAAGASAPQYLTDPLTPILPLLFVLIGITLARAMTFAEYTCKCRRVAVATICLFLLLIFEVIIAFGMYNMYFNVAGMEVLGAYLPMR